MNNSGGTGILDLINGLSLDVKQTIFTVAGVVILALCLAAIYKAKGALSAVVVALAVAAFAGWGIANTETLQGLFGNQIESSSGSSTSTPQQPGGISINGQ